MVNSFLLRFPYRILPVIPFVDDRRPLISPIDSHSAHQTFTIESMPLSPPRRPGTIHSKLKQGRADSVFSHSDRLAGRPP
jgi:hypothetical protein